MPPAASQDPKSEVTLRVRCRHCDRVQTRRGRSGIWWRCKHEDCRAQPHRGLNPGPLMEAAVMAPRALQRQRRRRAPTIDAGAAGQPDPAARNAEGPDGHVQGVAAPASVRRRTRKAAAAAAAPSAPTVTAPVAPAAPGPKREVSWLDRHVFGVEDE